LIAATVTTTAWYVMGDPFGIDDIYIALATPAVVMLLDWLIMGAPKAAPGSAMEVKAQ
jgi:SSS family solute:Na+ symporter